MGVAEGLYIVKATHLLAAVLASLTVGDVGASTLTMFALSSDRQALVGVPRCSVKPGGPCEAPLPEIFSLIGLPAWRQGLAEDVQLVRIVLIDHLYALDSPLRINWGRDKTRHVTLEIAGDDHTGQHPPILSGARSLIGERNEMRWQSTSGRARIAVFKLPSWPIYDPQPPNGLGHRIEPLAAAVFYKEQALPLAGWPNAGYSSLLPLGRPRGRGATKFRIADVDARRWTSEKEPRASAFWSNDWDYETLPVRVTSEGELAIVAPSPRYGLKAGQRVRVENALRELDSPGEWYLDRASKQLYVWPPAHARPQELEVAVASSLLDIVDSSGVVVDNVSFEKSRGDAVSITNSENVALLSVAIRNVGNRGVVIKGGRDCGISNSRIEETGEGGVVLIGGDRRTLRPSNHFAIGNTIRRFAQRSKTYRPAILIEGVGQRAIGNTISDGPHAAIIFKGNDHFIAWNEIFNVVKESSDAGAIYAGRDLTARGTTIDSNLLHDIKPGKGRKNVRGIYLDDQLSGIEVCGNVFVNVSYPVFIGGGNSVVVEHNVFYRSSPAIHLDARGLSWQREATLSPTGSLQRSLDAVPYSRSPYSERYPGLARIREDEIGRPKYNLARSNVMVESVPYEIEPAARDGIAIEGRPASGKDLK
jgi:hypothetical protein